MNYEYQGDVIAHETDGTDEVTLRMADWTPDSGSMALAEAAGDKGIDLTKPSEGDTVGRARLTAEGDVVEFCFPDEPFEDERLHSHVLGHLDGSASTMSALIEAFEAADAGWHTDRLRGADEYLNRAFGEIDQDLDDVNAERVLDLVSSAVNFVSEVRRGVSTELREFEIPPEINSGVYDELGAYVDYAHGDLLSVESHAKQYVEASH